MSARLSVHVVLWNSENVIRPLLQSLKQQTISDIHHIFVDNNSSDASADIVAQEFSKATLIRNEKNLGFCAAHNQGIRLSDAPYLAIINPDIVLSPDVLEVCAQFLDHNPEVASVGTKLLKFGEESAIIDAAGMTATKFREFLNRGEGERDNGQYDSGEEIFGLSGAFLVLRKTALETIRIEHEYLDEDIFAYKDDIDLAWRLRLAGWKNWYLPQPAVQHQRHVGRTLEQSPFSRRQEKSDTINALSYRNHLFVLLKNDRWRSWFFPWPRLLFVEVGKLFYLVLFERQTLSALPKLVKLFPKISMKRKSLRLQRKRNAAKVERWFR